MTNAQKLVDRFHISYPQAKSVRDTAAMPIDSAGNLVNSIPEEAVRNSLLVVRVVVGTMLEVPALLWQLPQLLAVTDFISVGSNDLLQFLFASDRGSPNLSGRYDVLSPPALTLFRDLAAQCTGAGCPLTLCGEIAGQPLEAMALVALGFRRLSMNPRAIGPVRAMIRSLDCAALRAYLDTLIGRSAHSVREPLRFYAHDHRICL